MVKLIPGLSDPSTFQAHATSRALGPTTGAEFMMGVALPFDWEIEAMWAYIARWFITEREPHGVSVVGIMSSVKFCGVISQFVGWPLGNAFRRLLFSTSILTLEDRPFGSHRVAEDLVRSIAYAGNQVLRMLEALLEPRALSQADPKKLGAIFIILVGTIIAVGFVTPKMLMDHSVS